MGAILEKSGVWIKNIEVAKKNMTFARLLVGVSFVLSYSFLFFQGMRLHEGGAYGLNSRPKHSHEPVPFADFGCK